MAMQLDQVIPWGRSMAEYREMFDLTDTDLSRRILGCGDGPASFNAEMTAAGYSVLSCDPIYVFTAEQIEARVQATYQIVVDQVSRSLADYVWTRFASPQELGAFRLASMQRFLVDYEGGQAAGRYQVAELPVLPFEANHFDLALCSHLLFLYSNQFSLEFHIASLRELMRVAPEVRVFPLLGLDCQVSPHLEPVRQQLTADGYQVALVPVDYEFQRGGNQMLRITRAQ